MIDWISTWAQSIIIAVIIATIIEMILPSGSSKKYILQLYRQLLQNLQERR